MTKLLHIMMMDPNTRQYKENNQNRANAVARHNAMISPKTANKTVVQDHIMKHVEDAPSWQKGYEIHNWNPQQYNPTTRALPPEATLQTHNSQKSARILDEQVTPIEKRTKLAPQSLSENTDIQNNYSGSAQHTSHMHTINNINTTRSEEEVVLEPKISYTESLINQLKRMHLKQPVRIDGQVHDKSLEELERQWEKSPHLTVVMEDKITEKYIQELLETALIFYFS
jgi:hypothetical protein